MNDEIMKVVLSPHADLDFAFSNCLWYEKNWITSLCKRKTLDTHVLLLENHCISSCCWIDSAIFVIQKKKSRFDNQTSSHAQPCSALPLQTQQRSSQLCQLLQKTTSWQSKTHNLTLMLPTDQHKVALIKGLSQALWCVMHRAWRQIYI